MNREELDRRFNYHAPDEAKRDAHQAIRVRARLTAQFYVDMLPEGREKSLAITKLEEAMFWANAAIARSGAVE